MKNLCKLIWLDLLEGFAALLQLFEGFQNRLSHTTVGLLRTAEDGELLSGCDSLVPVTIIEAEAKKGGLRCWFVFPLFCHAVTVLGLAALSSGISLSTAEQ